MGMCAPAARAEGEFEMNLTIEGAKRMMDEISGSLDLRGTPITSLPDNLTVGVNLDLSNTQITSLPDNLTVGGWLDLRGTQITNLPDNLTVGRWLGLSGTQITSLPDNLTVGGNIDLRGTPITNLPDNLTVGRWLDLSGTQITSLPDNLTVGGGLYLRGTQIKAGAKYKKLNDGDYVPGKYLYCDGILTHIKAERKIGEYTIYIGKIKGKNVVSDGTHYAHCKTLIDGIADLAFKKAKDRGADQYKGLSLDTIVTLDEAKTMYRVITGACQQGTESFASSLKDLKEQYTIGEMIEITSGQYNSERFRDFFEG